MDKLQIVCIDDQREVLAAVKKDLQTFEDYCQLTVCESAAEAEEVLQDLPVPALIICDHIMPGENGIDFFVRLQKARRLAGVQKMLLTGLATQQETIKAINEARIDYYIEKPWLQSDFQQAVKKLLTRFIVTQGLDKQAFAELIDAQEVKQLEQ